MTQIDALLRALGWSRQYAAGRCGVTFDRMRRWATGLNARGNPTIPPPEVVNYLLACLDALDRVPPPSNARHKTGAWTAETAQTP